MARNPESPVFSRFPFLSSHFFRYEEGLRLGGSVPSADIRADVQALPLGAGTVARCCKYVIR